MCKLLPAGASWVRTGIKEMSSCSASISVLVTPSLLFLKTERKRKRTRKPLRLCCSSAIKNFLKCKKPCIDGWWSRLLYADLQECLKSVFVHIGKENLGNRALKLWPGPVPVWLQPHCLAYLMISEDFTKQVAEWGFGTNTSPLVKCQGQCDHEVAMTWIISHVVGGTA